MSTRILVGDCRLTLPTLPERSVRCCVTSPPYWGLRDYGHGEQIGLESTPDAYVEQLVAVFREVRRVLTDDGTLWLNLGDSYTGSANAGGNDSRTCDGKPNAQGRHLPTKIGRPKNLIGIPWRVAFALQADGWYLRSDIIWAKPNPMPESVTDRPTKAHEYVFLLSKSARYYYDAAAIAESLAETSVKRGPVKIGGIKGENYNPLPDDPNFRNGSDQWGRVLDFSDGGTRNARTVWSITTSPYSGAHFATMPPELAERCVKAGSSDKGGCGTCGAPVVREVSKTKYQPPEGTRFVDESRGDKTRKMSGSEYNKSVRVLGECWLPSCDCGKPFFPDTILDPFGGAGTTGLVADRLGRNAILCELNPTYAGLAEQRVTNDSPLFSEVIR